jgi:hypothetical protein
MNLSDVDVQSERVVVPPGSYLAEVYESDIKNSKNTARPMLCIVFRLAGNDSYNGALLYEYFVLDNDIARSRLKTLATAARHPNPNHIVNSEELHGLKVGLKLKVVNEPEYGESNKITAFLDVDKVKGGAPAPSTSTAASAKPTRPWSGGKPPF